MAREVTEPIILNSTGQNIVAELRGINEELSLLDAKQDKLVSGQNIKTINGQDLLGEGNIVIQGGGGGSTVTMQDNPNGGIDLTVDGVSRTVAKEENIKENKLLIDFNNNNCSDRMLILENNNFSFTNLDKGKIIFFHDDSWNWLSDVYSIFHKYNTPFCEAVITKNINNIAKDGRKISDILNDIVNDGGEIFSHSTDIDICTVDSLGSLAAIEERLKESKIKLEEYGYEIHGWISPNEKFEPLAKNLYSKYYRYACGGNSINDIRFNFTRHYLPNLGLSGAKELVDDATTNKKVIVLFSHFSDAELDKFSYEDLEELLVYCKNKNVDITTYKDVIYNFGSYNNASLNTINSEDLSTMLEEVFG